MAGEKCCGLGKIEFWPNSWILAAIHIFWSLNVGALDRLRRYLLYLGLPGLFAVAMLDSAAVPMAGGPDGLIVLLAWQRPDRFLLIAAIAALGSTLGCLILYRIARAGGNLALSRMTPQRAAWVEQKIARNAFSAVLLSVMAPPPFPTKPIIIAAGAFRTPLSSFTSAVLIGRLIRYSAMAYLGSRFGDQAVHIIRSHYPAILLALGGAALLSFAARRLRRA